MAALPYFALVTLTQVAAGALVSGGALRRWIAVVVPAIALAFPLLAPSDPTWVRAVLGLGQVMTLLRTIDLAKERRSRSLLFRVVHVAIPFDTRRLERGVSSVSIAALGKVTAYGALTAVGIAGVSAAGPVAFDSAPTLLLRWSSGLLCIYASSEVAYGTSEIVLRAAGFAVYPFHCTPAASLSVKEFWGERWNRTVMMWLREHCLRPVAKRWGARLGLLAAFVASAFLHAYLAAVSLGLWMGLSMLVYFVSQAALVGLEAVFAMPHRPRATQRAWTIAVMTITSPLFVEPGMRVIGL